MTENFFSEYASRLNSTLSEFDWRCVEKMAEVLFKAWQQNRQVFLCGNGGSAANAIHFANDLIYGAAAKGGVGLRVTALSANQSILTCVANDISYEDIFSYPLSAMGQEGDILIALSGSGNSKNIVKVLEKTREMKITTFAVLGYSGGKSLKLADFPIHFLVDDMQVAEDCQQIVGHMIMRWLNNKKNKEIENHE